MGNLNKGTSEYIIYDKCTDFIIHEMNFYSWEDFLVRAERLKTLYSSSNSLVKQLYIWYVYSRRMTVRRKNKVWDYLNNNISFKNLTK